MRSRRMRDLSIAEIEEIAKDFKEGLQREANRYVRRHATAEALAALESIEYIDKFLFDLKYRATSGLREYLSRPPRARSIHIPKTLRK